MSKTSHQLSRHEKDNDGIGSVLSFIGGVVFIAAVVSYTVYNNQAIREEIEKQIGALLGATRNVIEKTREIMIKINEINELLNPGGEAETLIETAADSLEAQNVEYDSFWENIVDI
ncbi:MAG: hypothetical protein FWH50_03400 [Coriobacteriia bacterium]|nr:hypothetical protein [Coriobacteriia bacterium]